MAQALLFPLVESGAFPVENILAVVKTPESAKRLVGCLPKGLEVRTVNDKDVDRVWASSVLLLAVKPQQFTDVLDTFPQPTSGSKSNILISVLAGVTLSQLEKAFPNYFCVRAVPNAPVFVKAGLTGISFGHGFKDSLKNSVKEFFYSVSEVLELPESQLDSFLALTSSGPAYIALVSEAMADGAVAAGLPRSLANHLAHRTIAGTADLLDKKDLHPGQLKDMVASPAGTTIAALRKLEEAGVRSTFIEAVIAAAERSRELSRLGS